jgi:DNA-directed RNA polymerase subunit alpha
MEYQVTLPSKPRIVREEGMLGVYEIDNLYPGYGHTLGNSLRRIVLSSLPGAAITLVKIDGVPHEFATIEGVKEDVLGIILNLKKIHFNMLTDEPQTLSLSVKGPQTVTAADISLPGQVEVINKDQYVMDVTGKVSVSITIRLERGLGYVPKELHQKEKVDVGAIALDATFTPIRRANYAVENMRVGDRTDFNRLSVTIETNGTLSPREALERSIEIMVHQLKAIIGFQDKKEEEEERVPVATHPVSEGVSMSEDVGKMRVDELPLPTRILTVLEESSIRTVGGLVRKSKEDLLAVEGLGKKAVEDIEAVLAKLGESLKE